MVCSSALEDARFVVTVVRARSARSPHAAVEKPSLRWWAKQATMCILLLDFQFFLFFFNLLDRIH